MWKIFFRRKKKGDGRKVEEKVSLEDRVTTAIRELKRETRKLRVSSLDLRERDKFYYCLILDSLRNRNRDRALVYTREINELRKGIRSIKYARTCLEIISLRLEVTRNTDEILTLLAAGVRVIRVVKRELAKVAPRAEIELTALEELLEGVLSDIWKSKGLVLESPVIDSEVEKILKEAEAKTRLEMKTKLPPIPIKIRNMVPILDFPKA